MNSLISSRKKIYDWGTYALLILFALSTLIYYIITKYPSNAKNTSTNCYWVCAIAGVCIIASVIIYLFIRKKITLIISASTQIILFVLTVVFSLCLNPWARSYLEQLPLSAVLSMSLFLVSYSILKRGTFIVWPPIFLLSLITYYLKSQGITLGSDVLAQIYYASWEDAKFYFTWRNIIMLLCAISVSITAWYVIHRYIRQISRYTLLSSGLLLLVPILGELFILKRYIQVNQQYIWPIGNTATFVRDSHSAIKTVQAVKILLNSMIQKDIQASISPENQYEDVICILHIGESVNAKNLHINGYHLNTTPYLSSCTDLINFKDCISSAPVTDKAVITMITNGRRAPVIASTPEYLPTSPSLVDFFHECKFKCGTFWDEGSLKSGYGFFPFQVEIFNRKADAVYGYPSQCVMEQLEDVYDFIKKNRGNNMFLLINNCGSHSFFHAFDRENPPFPVKELPPADFSQNKTAYEAEIYINAYNSTIHYTDKYISEIAKYLKGKPYVYIYMGDHGEFLGEDGFWFRHQAQCDKFYEYEACKVPFFMFYSPEFEAKHPHFKEALNQLRNNQHVSTAHEHLFHTVLVLMNVIPPVYDADLDLTKPSVKPYTGPHPDRQGKTLVP